MAHVNMVAPLAGVRVLDLSRLLPGPFCSLLLADMGAEVVKVEAVEGGDYARWYPPLLARGYGAFFGSINRGKRSLALDLKRGEGRALFLRLAQSADVVLESFRPGVMERLGVGWEALRAANPRLVMCAISGYGQDGPWATRAAHDMNALAAVGVLDQTAGPDGGPAVLGLQAADIGGALYAVSGILGALVQRGRTGAGAYIDVSMAEAGLSFHIPTQAEVSARGHEAQRGGELLTGGVACYQVYATRDGRHVSVGALEPVFWARFLAVIGLPESASQGLSMGAEGAETRRAIAARMREEDWETWRARFAAVDACVEPVLRPSEVAHNPQVIARQAVFAVEGEAQVATPLLDAAKRGPQGVRLAPRLGEDSAAVLAEAGLSEQEVAALVAAGVVGVWDGG
jgi:crotonobetainyl-CoA:carnitine CoA-transferase CaiB-like acyl-CoA transferase